MPACPRPARHRSRAENTHMIDALSGAQVRVLADRV